MNMECKESYEKEKFSKSTYSENIYMRGWKAALKSVADAQWNERADTKKTFECTDCAIGKSSPCVFVVAENDEASPDSCPYDGGGTANWIARENQKSPSLKTEA